MRETEETKMIDIVDLVFEEISAGHLNGGDISRSGPLMKEVMNDYGMSVKRVMECFRVMENKYREELRGLGYKSFVHWGRNSRT